MLSFGALRGTGIFSRRFLVVAKSLTSPATTIPPERPTNEKLNDLKLDLEQITKKIDEVNATLRYFACMCAVWAFAYVGTKGFYASPKRCVVSFSTNKAGDTSNE